MNWFKLPNRFISKSTLCRTRYPRVMFNQFGAAAKHPKQVFCFNVQHRTGDVRWLTKRQLPFMICASLNLFRSLGPVSWAAHVVSLRGNQSAVKATKAASNVSPQKPGTVPLVVRFRSSRIAPSPPTISTLSVTASRTNYLTCRSKHTYVR